MAQGTGTRLRAALMAGSMLVGLAGPAALAQETTRYTYDALGRLTSAIDSSGKKVVYAYDNAGNRTRLSNGAEFAELIPVAFSASSNAGTSGLATSGAMRDGQFGALGSIHVTQDEAGAWIMADLGQVKAVNHIELAPALALPLKAGPEDLNGALIQYSVDGTTWREAGVVSGAALATLRTISIGGVELRYLRLKRLSGALALGDLRLYASAAPAGAPLIAEPDAITSTGSAVTFDPRANDRDLDGHPISIVSVETPLHGQAVINGGTAITYTPDAGYFGPDSFVYAIADGHDATASARVSVTVRSAANHSPVAIADSFSVHDRPTATISGLNDLRPLDNDYDADGDVLAITALSAPAHGQAQVIGSNLVRYQPDVGYLGTDTFSYTLSDGRGGTASAAITVNAANAAPIAGADSFTVQQGASAVLVPIGNDSDPNGDPISITALTTPSKGTAVLNPDQTVTYTPAANAIGADSFAYTLTDARGAETQGSIAATITTPPPTGQLRVMEATKYGADVSLSGNSFIAPRSTAPFPYLANVYVDAPISSGKVYWEVRQLCGATMPGVTNDVGTARRMGGYGSYGAGFFPKFAVAWVPETVTSTTFGTPTSADIYGFALDADAKTLKIYKNNVLGPTLSLPFSGPYYAHSGMSYTSSSPDSISGQNCPAGDAKGEFLYGTALNYAPPASYQPLTSTKPAPPRAVDDLVFAAAGNAKILDPRANDISPAYEPLTIISVQQPTHGSAAIVDGASITYTAAASHIGEDSFSYSVTDNKGGQSTAIVRVLVGSGPQILTVDPPVAGKASWNLLTDGPLSLGAAGSWTMTPQHTFFAPIKAWGAAGGTPNPTAPGGGGGFATGMLRFDAGKAYELSVGGGGSFAPLGSNGGYNGGGHSGVSGQTRGGAGGGGYSAARASNGALILLAGGGGGGGGESSNSTGYGGGGGGGAQAGGTYNGLIGGRVGAGGRFQGASAVVTAPGTEVGGGGGGGGYLGGGAGQSSPSIGWFGGGGAGGTGFVDTTRLTDVSMASADRIVPANADDLDRAGAGAPSATHTTPGAPGRIVLGGGEAPSSGGGDPPYTAPGNFAPRAEPDSVYVVKNVTKTFDPRENDWDPNGDVLTIVNVTAGAHGSATINSQGSITYQPTSNHVGVETLTYTITDTSGATSTGAINVRVGAGYAFSISPPVWGKSTWDLETDGPLNLGAAGVWTITPQTSFTIPVKAWGAAGGTAVEITGAGGAGDFAAANVHLSANTEYKLYVGGGGTYSPKGANGGVNGGGNSGDNGSSFSGAGGGGYSGVRLGSGTPVLIAGGGGGQGWGGSGGGGGGATAQDGATYRSGLGGVAGQGAAFQGGDGVKYSYYGNLAGGGGGGLVGGGGGKTGLSNSEGSEGGGGGAGGTGFAAPDLTSEVVLLRASGSVPGGNDDPDRNGAAAPQTGVAIPGRLILLRGSNL